MKYLILIWGLTVQLNAWTATVSVTSETNLSIMPNPIAERAIVPFLDLDVKVENSRFGEGVSFVLQSRAYRGGDVALYLEKEGGVVSRLTKGSGGLFIIGPAYVDSDTPRRIRIWGSINNIVELYEEPLVAFDVATITIDAYSTVHNSVSYGGTFPILGRTYRVDTNLTIGSLILRGPTDLNRTARVGQLESLGGFSLEVLHENVNLSGFEMSFIGTAGNTAELTDVKIIDENGQTFAVPRPHYPSDNVSGTVFVFDGPLRVPVGRHEYRVIGKLGESFIGASVQTLIPYITPYLIKGEATGQWFEAHVEASGYGPSIQVIGREGGRALGHFKR